MRILGAHVRFERKFADSWIGAFWQAGEIDHMQWARQHHVWICLVPWFPLHISYWKPLPPLDEVPDIQAEVVAAREMLGLETD